jgi:hypothetical protein
MFALLLSIWEAPGSNHGLGTGNAEWAFSWFSSVPPDNCCDSAKSMEQSLSCEANQEIPRLLWNPKVRFRVHKSPPLVPILSRMHAVHILSPYFPKIHSDIFPSTPRSYEWSFPFRFSDIAVWYSGNALDLNSRGTWLISAGLHILLTDRHGFSQSTGNVLLNIHA